PAGAGVDASHVPALRALPVPAQALVASDAFAVVRQVRAAQALRLRQLAVSCYPAGHVPLALRACPEAPAASPGQEARPCAPAGKPLADDARDLYWCACERAAHGHFREAENLAVKATRLEPRDFAAWLLLAVCYHNLGADAQAVACYSTCIVLDPTSPWP